ncbi:CIC11C00000003619 [Sungouiella intermedia]|uniref:CIC11C00000003619 n=1 Tax=Sungouiella intermedia TaxID=45354 RepID=A0A1L0GKI8_9ASCO|nr:CIC11C00000003619 [[Candida] intermedia]
MAKYAIIGSGIIGLYTAYELLEAGVSGGDIKITAQFLPGDESINFTSPYAGGNFSCITGNDQDTLQFDKVTYSNLGKIQKKLGGAECGLDRMPSTEYWDSAPPKQKIESLKSYLDGYQEVSPSELPLGVSFGIKFLTWNFNCPKFLLSMQKYLAGQGVQFERRKLSHISQGFSSGVKFVFNCTGIGARSIGGVEDTKVYPTRGQVLVVKAPHINENVMRWGDDYATYIIKRPYSNDHLVLGGFLQKDDWTPDTIKEQNVDILQRTTTLLPKSLRRILLDRKLKIWKLLGLLQAYGLVVMVVYALKKSQLMKVKLLSIIMEPVDMDTKRDLAWPKKLLAWC